MSQFSAPPTRVSRGKTGAARGGGRPVTPAALVPVFRRFAQSCQQLARVGRPVTSAGSLPQTSPHGRARGAAAGDPARSRERRPGRWLCAAARAWHAVEVGTQRCRSSASVTLRPLAKTKDGTRNSVGVMDSWTPSFDRRRGSAVSRILSPAAAATRRRSHRRSGSPNRRRVDLDQTAAKVWGGKAFGGTRLRV